MTQMQLGKAPGPDGYSLLYYKTFADLLISFFSLPTMQQERGRSLPKDALRAHIAVILKEGKDP